MKKKRKQRAPRKAQGQGRGRASDIAQRPAWGFGATLSRVGLGAVAVLGAAAMLLLSLGSLLGTADMTTDNPMLELIVFKTDSILLNLLFLVLSVAAGTVLMLIMRHLGWMKHIRAWMLAVGLGTWILLVGCIWVSLSMSSPTQDSYIVTRAGVAAAMGDLSYIDAKYFIRFPFQLGYVLWTELWARLFNLTHEGYLVLEYINVICLALGEAALVLITDRLFKNREVTFATSVLLALFMQPVIFSTFLYGTIPGLCFALWSILLFIRYLQTDKWRYIVGAGLLLAVSVGLKLNNLILLVAMAIILIAHLLRGKALRRAAALVMLCVLVLPLMNLGKWQYSLRTDKDFGDGIPMLSWMAMGLNEAAAGPGWYGYEYTVGNFHAENCDSDAAAENSKAEIKERLEYFGEDPAYAVGFFKDKILSQWNETTYQSLWNNQVRGQYAPKTGIAAYACGEGEYTVKALMDVGVQFIYWGMLIATVLLLLAQVRKNPEGGLPETALYLIPLFFLGGFLYHALFEAKSQYVIGYVTLMIPYAVWGFATVLHYAKPKAAKLITRLARKKAS